MTDAEPSPTLADLVAQAALRDAANDVRRSHQPNEYDSCVACRHPWPCDAEMLAELVLTRAALAESPARPEANGKTWTCMNCGGVVPDGGSHRAPGAVGFGTATFLCEWRAAESPARSREELAK